MFTGIIETVGYVTAHDESPVGETFSVSVPGIAQRLAPGDSVAINGVCHTVERTSGDEFGFTSVGETLKRTNLGLLHKGAPVNIERAATLDTALSGHLVQGHVDGLGKVESFEAVGKDRLLAVGVPADVFDLVVPKGSIAIDGVSLTVIERVSPNIVTITIIPFTLDHTIIANYEKGTEVNVEADVIGKYVMEFVRRINTDVSTR